MGDSESETVYCGNNIRQMKDLKMSPYQRTSTELDAGEITVKDFIALRSFVSSSFCYTFIKAKVSLINLHSRCGLLMQS